MIFLAAGMIGNIKTFCEAGNVLLYSGLVSMVNLDFGMLKKWKLDLDFGMLKKWKTILHSEYSLDTDAITKLKLSLTTFGYDVFGIHGFLKLDIRQYCVDPCS